VRNAATAYRSPWVSAGLRIVKRLQYVVKLRGDNPRDAVNTAFLYAFTLSVCQIA